MRRLYYVIAALMLLSQVPTHAEGLSALWTQYDVSDDILKMSLHTDLNPLKPVAAKAELWLQRKDAWTKVSESEVEALTAMTCFVLRIGTAENQLLIEWYAVRHVSRALSGQNRKTRRY